MSQRNVEARVAACALLVVTLAGCTPPVARAAPSSPTPTSFSSGSSTSPTETSTAARGWIAGNEITLTSTRFYPESRLIVLQAVVRNTSHADSFDPSITGAISLAIGTGPPLPLLYLPVVVPGLQTSERELTFRAPAADPDLDNAVLLLGDDPRAWRLLLSSTASATGTLPISFPTDARAWAGGLGFRARVISVLPWECVDSSAYGHGRTGRSDFTTAEPSRSSLHIQGEFVMGSAIVGGDIVTEMSVVSPNGSATTSTGVMLESIHQGEVRTGVEMCFEVDEPVSGTYRVTIDTAKEGSGGFEVVLP